MELRAKITNMNAEKGNAYHDRSGLFRFPLNADEIRERLNFDSDMFGWCITVPDSPLEYMREDTPLEEMNQFYYMLENIAGKIHEKDIKAVREKWFHNLKEMCDNIGFIDWLHGRELEELAEKKIQEFSSFVPQSLLKCVSVSLYAMEMYKDDEDYLVTQHGVYTFCEPVY